MQRGVAAAISVLLAGGLAAGLTLTLSSSPSTSQVANRSQPTLYQYYRSAVGGSAGGPMMGGLGPWMMGQGGYQWMTGGAQAPGWMRGGTLPGYFDSMGKDAGQIMGRFWAEAPGPRVSHDEAIRLGSEVPLGGVIDPKTQSITFRSDQVHLVVLASPSMPHEYFRIANMVNPTIVVPTGAHVSIELINADTDMAHGLVVVTAGAAASWMPMMTSAPAFAGAALWSLGDATSAGMHAGTLRFTAGAPGTYQYLCPVPGHAQEGMVGTFVVRP